MLQRYRLLSKKKSQPRTQSSGYHKLPSSPALHSERQIPSIAFVDIDTLGYAET